ncbi:MAG: VWA domain-containing protein [Myxococcales bacterium]|nr:VWA domain-containing protein [Myxococcales bacterium]
MKIERVAALSLCGMLLSSLAVYGLTDPVASAAPASDGVGVAVRKLAEATPEGPAAKLEQEGTLRLEARLGHDTLAPGRQRTFVTVEVRGNDVAPLSRPSVHMALAIDRSGSMKGERLEQALRAAQGVVDRLADDDVVSVVSFDTEARVVVPAQRLSPTSREAIRRAIAGVQLGGDTCISCGIDAALAELARESGGLDRVIVLSDGAANHGVKDIAGFQRIGAMCRNRGTTISTVGVGVDYNERLLSAVAFESNGLHHFVEDEASLAAVFDAETQSAVRTVASDAAVELSLAPNTRLVRVFVRSFERQGDRLVVPLGTFAPNETKTLLVEVEVDTAAGVEGQPIADLALRFRDHASDGDGVMRGSLGVRLGDRQSLLDPFVEVRLERARTSAVLDEANALARQGRFADAKARVAERRNALAVTAEKSAARKDSRRGDIDESFRQQIDFADDAVDAFEGDAPATAAPRAVRQNQERLHSMNL